MGSSRRRVEIIGLLPETGFELIIVSMHMDDDKRAFRLQVHIRNVGQALGGGLRFITAPAVLRHRSMDFL